MRLPLSISIHAPNMANIWKKKVSPIFRHEGQSKLFPAEPGYRVLNFFDVEYMFLHDKPSQTCSLFEKE